MCMSILFLSSDPPKEGIKSHYKWLWVTMWLLGMEACTSGQALGILNHWAISPAPYFAPFPQFLIRYFVHLHFICYPEGPPYHPSPTPLPTHSYFLALVFPCTGAYKVCKTKEPLFPMVVYSFMLKSSIHLDLSFVQGDKYGYIFTFLYNDSQLD